MSEELVINNRTYQFTSSLEKEFALEDNKNYLFDLSYLGAISVLGEKAIEFLQGQVTADMRKVQSNSVQKSAFCNLKGRVLALMDVIDWQGIKLILPEDMIDSTITSLNKTALLSRVILKKGGGFHIYGFYLANDKDLLPLTDLPKEALASSFNENIYCYCLDKHRYILLVKKEKSSEISQPFIEKDQMKGSLSWHYLNLIAEQVEIYPDTRGLFLPHRLHLHLNNYISFDKGCYKGQEIIARTHYRATLKHTLTVFKIKASEPIAAGKKLFALNNSTEVGEIIDYCPLANNEYLIAAAMLLERPLEFILEGYSSPVKIEALDLKT